MADTAAQAQARKVIGLPDDQEWTDANVRGHLRRQGFTDPSFTNEVLANGAGTSDSIKNMTPVNVFGGYNLPQGGPIQAVDPMARNSGFIDTRTGQLVAGGGLPGGLTADGRTLMSMSGKHKTYSTDVATGVRTDTTQHPWRDALKNAAMIMGPSIGAGALAAAGAFGGAGAVGPAGAGYGGGGASTIAGTAGANLGAAGTAGTAAGHSLVTPMLLSAAENAAMTKASGGSWGQTALSAGIGAGTAGLAPGLSTLGPAARTAANFGISQGASAAMRAAGGGSNKNSTSTYGRGTESTGLGPSSGAMQQGFGYNDSNPNIAALMRQGTRTAIKNQPFRQGYSVVTGYNDDKTPITTQMPPIYPNRTGGNGQRKKKSIIGDALTINGPSDSGGSSGSDGGNKQPTSY